MSDLLLRLGIWAPTSGGFFPAPAVSADLHAATRDYVLRAEELGYDSVLFAQHTLRTGGVPGNEDVLEAWTSATALAAETSRIEVIAAIKPKLYHPVVLAKLALGIENISKGRFAINFVNAWFKPELERAGIPFDEHDERYAYGAEWLSIVKRLIAGETVTHQGKYFQIDSYRLRPASLFRDRPVIYAGGESEPARDVAAALADVWFLNGQTPEEAVKNIADVTARRTEGPPLRFAMSAYVIARETDAEAQAEYKERLDFLAGIDRTEFYRNIDPKAVMFHTFRKTPHVGTNGGTAAGLVGDYDTVARRILEFRAVGVEVLMLQFHPWHAEMERFAAEVIPRVKALAQVQALAQAKARTEEPVGV